MTLSDKYELIRQLGYGACGNVYLVKHRTLNILRAVKIISKQSANATHILNAALIIKNLKHQGIPIVYDIDETADEYCIYEEYVEGITLRTYMQHSTCTLTDILQKALDLCSILCYLHHCDKGILHLDLKPDNIMIDTQGKLWLIDYDNAAMQGDVLPACRGSVGFAPPQQYFGNKPNAGWDIYSLGMLILYMSEGNIHSGISHMRHKQLIPIVKKCVHHSGFARYRTVEALQKDLQNVLKEKSGDNRKYSSASLTINVSGTDRGVGTTHFCLCLCSFLNRQDIPCAIVNCGDTGSYSLICSRAVAKQGSHLHADININNGIIRDGHLYLIASDTLTNTCKDCKFQVIIRDYGNRKLPKSDTPASDCYYINVCCPNKPFYEINRRLHSLDREHSFIIWNLCSADFFYNNTMHSPLFNYRMPCVYDFDKGSPLCDSMLYELIRDMDCRLWISPPKSLWKGGRKKRIMAYLRQVAADFLPIRFLRRS